MQNKLTWIFIVAFILCGLIVVVGWIGVPYYTGIQIKRTLIGLGAPADVIVKSSYWKQQVNIKNLVIIPPSPSFIKKIIIPEIFLSYNGSFLLTGRVNIIKISTIEILIPNNKIDLTKPLPFNVKNINTLIHMFPKKQLVIEALVLKDTTTLREHPNNAISIKLTIQPEVIIKHHYNVNLKLYSDHLLVLLKQSRINGNDVEANLKGTLKLENDITFDGNLKIKTMSGMILPNNIPYKKAYAAMQVKTANNHYLLKGEYRFTPLSSALKPAGNFSVQSGVIPKGELF